MILKTVRLPFVPAFGGLVPARRGRRALRKKGRCRVPPDALSSAQNRMVIRLQKTRFIPFCALPFVRQGMVIKMKDERLKDETQRGMRRESYERQSMKDKG